MTGTAALITYAAILFAMLLALAIKVSYDPHNKSSLDYRRRK